MSKTSTLERKQILACSKIRGNCLRAASQLLLAQAQPLPCPATTAGIRALLHTDSLPQDEQDALHSLREAAKQISTQLGTFPVCFKLTVHRTHILRTGAQPGPSGARNGHLRACLQAQGGAEALHRWCCLWARGAISPHIATIFTHGWIAPLAKPSGGIRPFTLFAAPLKLATGV